MEFREFFERLIFVLLGLLLATLFAYVSATLLTGSLLIIYLTVLGLITLYYYSPDIERSFSRYRIRRRYKKSKVGIIEERGLEQENWKYTRFSPAYWHNRLGRTLDVRLIPIEEISNEYAVIINPYGEIYPETDLQYLETLSNIKKYIEKGGVFVNVAGCAFWWAWSRSAGTPVRLAKDTTYYKPNPQTGLIEPVYLVGVNMGSLVDMPLSKFFNVLTTTGDTQTEIVTQQPQDREYAGEITVAGGTNRVREFRAIREPVRECIPFLRITKQAPQGIYEIFPMAGIRLKRGWLILCGMDLNIGIVDQGVNLDAADSEKISVAVENFQNNLRRGNIPIRV